MNPYNIPDTIIDRTVKKARRRSRAEPAQREPAAYTVSLEEIAARQVARGLDLIFGLDPATSGTLEASKVKRNLEEI